MAIGTLTPLGKNQNGKDRERTYTVQATSGANSTAGGETITAAQVGLNVIFGIQVLGAFALADGSANRVVVARVQNPSTTIKLSFHSGATEVAAGTDLSLYTGRVLFRGR